jgi:hypothetical protein
MSDLVERLRGSRAQLWGTDWPEEAADEIAHLTARVAELEGTLRFYADSASWISPFGATAAVYDGGNRARAALTTEKGGE